MEAIREIERLRILADWYRNWALTSGSEEQRSSRLGLADHIDAKAQWAHLGLSESTSLDSRDKGIWRRMLPLVAPGAS